MKCPRFVALSVILLSSSVAIAAGEGDDLKAALTSGQAGVNLRARYEHVDQDSFLEDADALTARLRLNYSTGAWKNLSAFVEFDYVFHLLDDFNSSGGTSPNRIQYPAIVDPDGADLNQLSWTMPLTETQAC